MTQGITQAPFAKRVIDWQRAHGRHNLPWQNDTSPYRTWVSEIMLQQTQVAVVIDYFNRWVARFPDAPALANAPLDTVLEHWAGLGYYARARNLHKAAKQVVAEHSGELPANQAALEALPGIGRSTAGAILSLGFGQVAAILDGNVKRVLARHAGIEGWPGRSAVLRQLWQQAEERLPSDNAVAYTQGLMDLGATLCSRHNPECNRCPVASDCIAKLNDTQQQIPAPKPKQPLRQRHSHIILATYRDRVLLHRRPANGIWGGLWAPPIVDAETNIDDAAAHLGLRITGAAESLPAITHQLTHFRWHLQPVRLEVEHCGVQDDVNTLWQAIGDIPQALPAPIAGLLEQLASTTQTL